MTRNKKKNKHLPQHLYKDRNGFYLLRDPRTGKCKSLGKEFPAAMRLYGELVYKEGAPCRTMAEVIRRYIEEIAPKKALKTYAENVRQSQSLVKVFGHMLPETITQKDVYLFLDSKIKSPVAGNREVALLSHVFTKAIRWGYCTENPCLRLERHRVEKRKRQITDEEYKTIYGKVSILFKAIMDICYLTGCRRGDALRIKESDIFDDLLHIVQGKNGNKQAFKLSNDLREAIEAARATHKGIISPWLFCATRGQHRGHMYTNTGIQSMWQRYLKKEGMPENVHFHDIRRKSGRDADTAGKDAQKHLGHATRAMTDHYIATDGWEIIEPLEGVR